MFRSSLRFAASSAAWGPALLIAAFAIGAPSIVLAGDPPQAVPGEYAVILEKGADVEAVRAAVASATGYPTTKVGRLLGMLKLVAPPEQGEAASAAAARVPGVKAVEPNYYVEPLRGKRGTPRPSRHVTTGIEATPGDPLYPTDQDWYFNRIEAPEAWDIQPSASSRVVAVIDDGILYEHEDLEDRMWENDGETGATERDDDEDDDNNGYVDDADGWDFFEGDNDPSPFDDPEEDRNGFYGEQGTFVAGVVGAEANNGAGIAGICWNVQLMNLRVFDEFGPFFGNMIDVAEAIDYAVAEDADVILIPWVIGFFSITLENALDRALDEEKLVVCAAGDFASDMDAPFGDYYPPNYELDNLIVVMATIEGANATQDDPLPISNFGQTIVHLGAPGEAIWGPLVDDVSDSEYKNEDGTAGAAALVAGAAALIMQANPALDYSQVKDLILDNVDPVDGLDGLCETGGRLNLLNALEQTPVPPPTDPPPPPPPPPGSAASGSQYRQLGGDANVNLGYGFYYSYLHVYYGPRTNNSYVGYGNALYSYAFGVQAGYRVLWGGDTDIDEAFGTYLYLRYLQFEYAYDATEAMYYAYLENEDDTAGLAALYLYYSALNAYYDLVTPYE